MKPSKWSFLLYGAKVVTAMGAMGMGMTDGKCGGPTSFSCFNSMFGSCCSKDGFCGSTPEHCGSGCQSQFGHCSTLKGQVSPHGRCGEGTGYSCEGSTFGECCSVYGFCGSTPDYCGKDCDPKFGKCVSSNKFRRSFPPLPTLEQAASKEATVKTCTAPMVMETVTSTVWVDPPAATGSGNDDSSLPTTLPDPYKDSIGSISTRPDCKPCEGQPGNDPATWCGLSIHTNYYEEIPKTCRIIEYTLNVENATIAPDGIERVGLILNGQMPGPMIQANWGDTVRVHVINALTNNGTSLHFHGSRMNHTNDMDGVPSITQCPIPPGGQQTYEWVASQYGHSWYHSHFAIQAWEGAFGPLVIHGPKSEQFDFDVGPITIQDWSHQTVDAMYDAAQDSVNGGPRTMDNGLLNGMNTWGPDGTSNQTGKRLEMEFIPGKKHLIRLVNTAIQSTFKFSIDGHKMTVISADFTSIEPYETEVLSINIGQRYSVIVEANQAPGTYWMRADNQNACAATIQANDIKGIIKYAGHQGAPQSTPHEYDGGCTDEPADKIRPILQLDAGRANVNVDKDVTIAPDSDNMFKWYLSGETFTSNWNNPTLYQYLENGTHTFTDNLIIDLPNAGEWAYLIIQTSVPLPHPIHLHGHDFYELASGPGQYNPGVPLKMKNPSRRDTALLPGNGYLVIGWVVDNPGVWLAHCHIGWHTSMGMALQFSEITSQIKNSVSKVETITDTCNSWNTYLNDSGLKMLDSGV